MKKGFTLIELLAVLVILAIIMVIAIPSILTTIQTAKRGAFESDTKLVINAIQNKKGVDESFDATTINEDNIDDLLSIPNTNYASITVLTSNNKINVVIVGKGEWNGYTAYGDFNNLNVVENTGNGDPLLTGLTTSVGTLSPAFDPNTFTYNIAVPSNTTSVDITPTIGDAYSIIDVNGKVQTSGGSYTHIFATDETYATLNVRVTSITGNEDLNNTYTINIIRGVDTNLSALILKSGSTTLDFSPSFNPNTTAYTITVNSGISSVTVTPSASDATNAIIRVNNVPVLNGTPSQAISLPLGGSVTIAIKVSNGVPFKQYEIAVTRLSS